MSTAKAPAAPSGRICEKCAFDVRKANVCKIEVSKSKILYIIKAHSQTKRQLNCIIAIS